jgi:hypothetical protein
MSSSFRRALLLCLGLPFLLGCPESKVPTDAGVVSGRVIFASHPNGGWAPELPIELELVPVAMKNSPKPPPGVNIPTAMFTKIPVNTTDGTFWFSSAPLGDWLVVIKVGGGLSTLATPGAQDLTPEQKENQKKMMAQMVAEGKLPNIPESYTDPSTTPLTWTIQAGKNPSKEFNVQ